MKKVMVFTISALAFIAVFVLISLFWQRNNEKKVLAKVISRLEANSRIAEVLVTGVNYSEDKGEIHTTIKFLEYDVEGKPLEPKYFTFSGNIIQFQSLVIHFDDARIKEADGLKGKSALLFWKVFMLDRSDTQEYEITKIDKVPEGYRIGRTVSSFERKLWKKFWEHALNPKRGQSMGINNAQIETPGMMFVPGIVYTVRIEQDGKINIDAFSIPDVLKGEFILK